MQIEDGNVLHIKGEGGKEEQHNGGWVSWVSGVIMLVVICVVVFG